MVNWLKISAVLLIYLTTNTKAINNSSKNLSLSNESNIDYRTPIGLLSPETCRLRSKRFISNGLCTSPKPIGEVVCAETCSMPAATKNPFSFHLNSLRKRRSSNNRSQRRDTIKWRCEEGSFRKKRVKLLCHDGTIKAYNLKLITSCRCSPISSKHQSIKTERQ